MRTAVHEPTGDDAPDGWNSWNWFAEKVTDKEIIAIDQDRLGQPAGRIYAEGPIEIWARPLADGSRVLAIFNFGEQRSYLRGISMHLEEAGAAQGWHARDVWMAKDIGPISDTTPFSLPRHGSILLRLSK